MQNIEKYYNPKRVSEFQKSIPSLRLNIAKEAWSNDINEFGIDGNTFRAFTGWSNRPSDLYRTWAEKQCRTLDLGLLAISVESRENFEEWHASLCTGLQRYWKRQEQGKGLTIAHNYKVIDLYIKWLSKYNFGSPNISDGLVTYAHCAIDSKILEALNLCLSNALPLKNPSMGHITHKTTYLFCQELISNFSKHCGGTSLLFDYYAWPGGS